MPKSGIFSAMRTRFDFDSFDYRGGGEPFHRIFYKIYPASPLSPSATTSTLPLGKFFRIAADSQLHSVLSGENSEIQPLGTLPLIRIYRCIFCVDLNCDFHRCCRVVGVSSAFFFVGTLFGRESDIETVRCRLYS